MSSHVDTKRGDTKRGDDQPFEADLAMPDPEDAYDDDDDGQYDQYRTLSVSAVGALILGMMSLSALLFPTLLVIPAIGTALGLYAVWTVTARRDELTGRPVAVVGLALSAMLLVGGTALHWWVNRIEVPEHYQGKEITFWQLQPEEDIDMQYLAQLKRSNVPVPLPQQAMQLDGQEVFITGYVYPGAQKEGLKKFVLVPDMKTCCFGGQPKLTDMIEVKLKEPLTVDFSYRRRGLGGVLRVHSDMQAREQLTGIVYQLDADYVY